MTLLSLPGPRNDPDRPPVGFDVPPGALLGRRSHAETSPAARDLIAGRRVLVTGSAGSIGSELVRQLLRLDPAAVYRLDLDEGRMHALQLGLTSRGFEPDDHVVLADIRDRRRLERTFAVLRPDVVFHAAALKHLNLLERFPGEGVRTNVGGTHAVIDAALQAGVGRLINVSTDKAADPVSVLGATKRLAELLVQINAIGETAVASVRFGNVLGSRGSFYDTLSHQLRTGRPVTITDPGVTRFFMSIPEAVGLVIQAAVTADRGETYVLDMGDPVRILDLVDRYVALNGLPAPEIRITGLQPGEKLHETLFGSHERHVPTSHPRIRMAPADVVGADFTARLTNLYDLTDGVATDTEIRSALMDLVSGHVGAPGLLQTA